MKNVTDIFKIDLRTFGRQLDPKIKVNDVDFDADNFNYIKPAFYTTLFKTIMHQVEIDSKVYMPSNTKLNIKLGIKVNEKNYEYVKFGTYYVETCERQEDTNSYRIMAYTKIKESMIDYDLKIIEKITLRDYLIKICQRLGWNTENIPATFINSTKLVDPTLHTGIKYTFRDALDEIAIISCSHLLFKDDDFYLIYLNQTDADIDESYLDEDNITIGEKYFINSLVFSRVEESDNIYRKDDSNIALNGLHEYRISDCQLLSTNDRADYIDEMFNYLKTLEFYIFDIQSKGILFLEACDIFKLVLNGITYPTVLLNDEINIEDGLTESLYMDEPEETETEYKYADNTDKKINQTNFMVDKQNKKIEGLIKQIGDRSEKATTITADIDGINSKVENIEDVTNTVEGIKTITLENCVEGDLLELHIYGNNKVFDYLYPSNNLYPADDIYPYGDSRIIIYNYEHGSEESSSNEQYELGITEVLRQNEEACDEYVLEKGEAKIIRRVNKDGTTKAYEVIESLGKFKIPLKEGDNEIVIKNYTAKLKAKFAIKNSYTDIYATKVEMKSSITQTAEEINLEVSKKVDENEVISSINQSPEAVGINANKIELSANDILNLLAGNTINLSGKKIKISSNNFTVDENGNMSCENANIRGKIHIGGDSSDPEFLAEESDFRTYIYPLGLINEYDMHNCYCAIEKGCIGLGTYTETSMTETAHITNEEISIPKVTQTSLERIKKNISLYNKDALETIKNANIYTYNLKSEKDTDKKHIGFVIGDRYKTPYEVIAQSGEGIDTYSMCSILWKAVQELTEEIEKLKGGQVNG